MTASQILTQVPGAMRSWTSAAAALVLVVPQRSGVEHFLPVGLAP